uniref:Uncharacterized protein n=1 Tax=Anguilla anguilla TaxID=7936 RepID=A0A0E9QC77_ANGAN
MSVSPFKVGSSRIQACTEPKLNECTGRIHDIFI